MRFRKFYNIQYIYYCGSVSKHLFLFSSHFPLQASLKSNWRTKKKCSRPIVIYQIKKNTDFRKRNDCQITSPFTIDVKWNSIKNVESQTHDNIYSSKHNGQGASTSFFIAAMTTDQSNSIALFNIFSALNCIAILKSVLEIIF